MSVLAAWQHHDAALRHAIACAAYGDALALGALLYEWDVLTALRAGAGCVA